MRGATLLLLSAGHGAMAEWSPVPPGEAHVLAVTTAATPYADAGGLPDWLVAGLGALASIGFCCDPFDISGRPIDELRAALAPCDVLYVSGGNPFFLLQEMRATGFDALLDEFLADPAHLYVGASAGAAVMGPDIAYAAPMDDPALAPQLVSTHALGHVDVCVMPHVTYDERGDVAEPLVQACIAAIEAAGHPAVLLRDDEALVVRDQVLRVVPSPHAV